MEAVDFGSFIVVCIGCYTFVSFVYMLEGRSFITFTMFGFGSGSEIGRKISTSARRASDSVDLQDEQS